MFGYNYYVRFIYAFDLLQCVIVEKTFDRIIYFKNISTENT